jgi:parvulin-like peptidyl-prolyl isomerase
MIRTSNAVVNNPPARRLRQGCGALVAVALLAGGCAGTGEGPAQPAAAAAAAAAGGLQWLLRADGLEVGERSLHFALGIRKGPGGEQRDRAEQAAEYLALSRSRLLLAAAAVRRGYENDPAVSGPLGEYRFRHLVDQYLAEKVDGPARELAGDSKAGFRFHRDRLFKEASGRAVAAFPATIDEQALAAAVAGGPGDLVLARVAGTAITAEEMRHGLQRVDHPGEKQNTGERIARIVLGNIATLRSLAALAEREGIAARADFIEDLNDRRIRLLAERYTQSEIYPAVGVTAADVEARYARDAERLKRGEEREIFEILLPAEETAQAVAARLAAGAPFADEVRAHSIGSTRDAGGLVGLVQPKQLLPALDVAVQGLREGENSAPVSTPFGWHILRCERIVTGRVPPLSEVRAALEAEELTERRAAAVRERVSRLEGEIRVEVNERRYQQIVKGQVQ